jgi:hypothetical protein
VSRFYNGKALDTPLFPGWLGVVVKVSITIMMTVLFANIFAMWFD